MIGTQSGTLRKMKTKDQRAHVGDSMPVTWRKFTGLDELEDIITVNSYRFALLTRIGEQ